MERKLIKLIIELLAIVLLVIGIVYGYQVGRWYLGYRMRDYHYRYVECGPQEMLVDLGRVFHVDFPQDIKHVKAAKSVPDEHGDVLFIVKFIAEPNAVDRFLKSFPEKPLKIELEPYEPEFDRRRSPGYWPPPKWFTKPIRQGKKGAYILADGKKDIYIDTTDEKGFVVYITGWYHPEASEGRNR